MCKRLPTGRPKSHHSPAAMSIEPATRDCDLRHAPRGAVSEDACYSTGASAAFFLAFLTAGVALAAGAAGCASAAFAGAAAIRRGVRGFSVRWAVLLPPLGPPPLSLLLPPPPPPPPPPPTP